MSETINCSNCGMLLYFGEEIRRRLYMRAIPDEATVLGFYGHVCPRCGSELSEKTTKIEIKGRHAHASR
jgi:transcription elongation factor Elf1